MQIGVDQIVNLGEGVIIDPNKLLCSICFTLNVEARECLNKRCKKLFCLNCINSLKNIQKENISNNNIQKPLLNKIPCPFCRVEADFYKAEENLIKIISNLKFYCPENFCLNKFNLQEFQEHYSSKKSFKYCYKCKDSTFLNYKKCQNCNNIFCNDCNFTRNCIGCYTSICQNCIPSNYKNKENFLCGLCEPECSNCRIKNIIKNHVSDICSFCNRFLCEDCLSRCKVCSITFCLSNNDCKISCSHSCEIKQINNSFSCNHREYLECKDCFPKCQYKIKDNYLLQENTKREQEHQKSNKKPGCLNKNKSIKSCKTCETLICIKDCLIKCKNCKSLICDNCSSLCRICKNIVCVDCSRFCDECPREYFAKNPLVFCQSCEPDVIRSCQKKDCNKNLCLNCWKVCNYCNLILCGNSNHSYSCLNCEENMCENHFHNCKECNKDKDEFNYKKLCLKNCSNQCTFCTNITNIRCSVENHNKNYVTSLNCGHNVCRECLKGCFNCKNIAISCPQCIVNYYFHKCKFCNFYLCTVCSRYCPSCEDTYCPFNMCISCNRQSENICSNCLNFEYENFEELNQSNIIGKTEKKLFDRNKCNKCKKKLENCDKCAKIFICNQKCYLDYKSILLKKFKDEDIYLNEKRKMDEICINFKYDKQNNFLQTCEMFECDDCLIKAGILKKLNDDSYAILNDSDVEITPVTVRSDNDRKMLKIDQEGMKKNCLHKNNIVKTKENNIDEMKHNRDSQLEIQNKLHKEIKKNNNDVNVSKSISNKQILSNHCQNDIKIGLETKNGNKNLFCKSCEKIDQNFYSDKKYIIKKKEKVTCLSMCCLY